MSDQSSDLVGITLVVVSFGKELSHGDGNGKGNDGDGDCVTDDVNHQIRLWKLRWWQAERNNNTSYNNATHRACTNDSNAVVKDMKNRITYMYMYERYTYAHAFFTVNRWRNERNLRTQETHRWFKTVLCYVKPSLCFVGMLLDSYLPLRNVANDFHIPDFVEVPQPRR